MAARKGQIAFASLIPPPETLAPERVWLVNSFESGRQVTRYGRTWRIGRSETTGDLLHGQIGFEDQNSTTTIWDDDAMDFRDVHPTHGYTSRFTLNLRTLRIAFELRGKIIRPWTFTTNLQALLSVNDSKWTVKVEGIEQLPWDEWVPTEKRITKLNLKLLPPNPRFKNNAIKSAFEVTKTTALKIGAEAGKGGTLDVEDPGFIQACIEHALVYGTVTATGYREEDGQQVLDTWRSSAEKDAKVTKVETDDDGRVARDALDDALEERERDADPE